MDQYFEHKGISYLLHEGVINYIRIPNNFLSNSHNMKGFIAVLLLSAFTCGTLASYAADDGMVKTELVKKHHDLVAVQVSQPIEIDAPAVQPINYITGEVNVKAISRPKEATANAPPLIILEQSPQENTRIRRLSRE
jgi:hypothetical protein